MWKNRSGPSEDGGHLGPGPQRLDNGFKRTSFKITVKEKHRFRNRAQNPQTTSRKLSIRKIISNINLFFIYIYLYAETAGLCFTRFSKQQEAGQHFQVCSQSRAHPLVTWALVAESILVQISTPCNQSLDMSELMCFWESQPFMCERESLIDNDSKERAI